MILAIMLVTVLILLGLAMCVWAITVMWFLIKELTGIEWFLIKELTGIEDPQELIDILKRYD